MFHILIGIWVTHTKHLSNLLEEYTYNLCISPFHWCQFNTPPPYTCTQKNTSKYWILLNDMHAEVFGVKYTDGLHLTLKYTRNKMYWRLDIWIGIWWKRYGKMLTIVDSKCWVLNCEYSKFYPIFYMFKISIGESREGLQDWSRMEKTQNSLEVRAVRSFQDFPGTVRVQLGFIALICKKASQHVSPRLFCQQSPPQPAWSYPTGYLRTG